jgi:hypothetical protein
MECWNIGGRIVLPSIPLFHCSIIPFLFLNSAFSASSWFILLFSCAGDPGKKELDSQKDKRTTNRRDPGGRRGEKRSIKRFTFLVFCNKKLCGLCVLCG